MAGDKRKWVLDTVFVVKDSFPYDPLDPRKALEGKVPETFLSVTGGPLAADPKLAQKPVEGGFRLYRGATPDDPVHGMYSFFPAIPASWKLSFPRPFVTALPDKYFNPSSWQAPKGAQCDCTCDELRCLWNLLVAQVRNVGLVLGTRAGLPRRDG